MEEQEKTETKQEKEEPTAARIWDQAKTHARDALDWGRRVSHVGKLKLDLARIHRDRQALYQELGRKTYELLKDDQFDPSILGDLCAKIDQINERIVDQQQQVEFASRAEPETDDLDVNGTPVEHEEK